ncbi:cellular communication network factor 1, like 2 [Corythoichthys intestinalis]|uniref:cellular communication network factor 1, like 2 n=1 Tax=Corythoichthys intestinalis TaxID=161448 RepID=UPI0025A66A75|nr:cellular communication network factor 1, like 2 [Corythoichthys intestinalis]
MLQFTVSLHQIFSTLFVVCSAVVMADDECPSVCDCAASSPICPAGVSWVTDHCGCCKMCARQFNEDCSTTQPCDHIKGLRCHLGVGGDPERGLCRAEVHGLPCEFNGQLYQHSENFQPSCMHQCTCIDGVVGCMPLCPQQVSLPNSRCSQPRLAQTENGCCEEWLCDDDNHIRVEPEELTRTTLSESQPLPNHISALLPSYQQSRPPAATGGTTLREKTALPMPELILESRCFSQTTDWTECSTSCGMGISSRVTNNNPDCQLIRETRLCQIRQCNFALSPAMKGKKCQKTVRSQEPIQIAFAGCFTVQRYRPRTCGSCMDGRCCRPSVTRTVQLRFRCPDGESFFRNMMWVQRCSCSKSCPSHGSPSSPSISLHNDIHTFRR